MAVFREYVAAGPELDSAFFNKTYSSAIGSYWSAYGANGQKYSQDFSQNIYALLTQSKVSTQLLATEEQAKALRAFVQKFNKPFGAEILDIQVSPSGRGDVYAYQCRFQLVPGLSTEELNQIYSSAVAKPAKQEQKPSAPLKTETANPTTSDKKKTEDEQTKKKAETTEKKKPISPAVGPLISEYEQNFAFELNPKDANLGRRSATADYHVAVKQQQECKISFKSFEPTAEELDATARTISTHLSASIKQIRQFSDAERLLRGSASMEAAITGERAKIYSDATFAKFIQQFVRSVWEDGFGEKNRAALSASLKGAMQKSSDPQVRAAAQSDENISAVLSYAYTHYRNVRVAYKRLSMLWDAVSADPELAKKFDLTAQPLPTYENVIAGMLGKGNSQIFVTPALIPGSGPAGISKYRKELDELLSSTLSLGGRGILEEWVGKGWATHDAASDRFSILWGMGAKSESALTNAMVSRSAGPLEDALAKYRTTGISLAQDGTVIAAPSFAKDGYGDGGFEFTYSLTAKTKNGKEIAIAPQVAYRLWRVEADENGKPILENGKVKKTEVRLYDKDASEEYNASATAWVKTEGGKVKIIPLEWNSKSRKYEAGTLEGGLYQVDIDARVTSYSGGQPRENTVRSSVRVNLQSRLAPQPQPLQFERTESPSGPYGDHAFELKTPMMKMPPLYTSFAPALNSDVALVAIFYDPAMGTFNLIPPKPEGELEGMGARPPNIPLTFDRRTGALSFKTSSGKQYRLCSVDISDLANPKYNFENTLSAGSPELASLVRGGYVSMRRVLNFGSEDSPEINISNEKGDELGSEISVYGPSVGTVTIAGKIYLPQAAGRKK